MPLTQFYSRMEKEALMKGLLLVVLFATALLSLTACEPWWWHHYRGGYDRGGHYDRR